VSEVRERTLYGRRRGKKLRDGQQSLLVTLLPRLTVVVPPELQKIDLAGLFGGALPADGVWLEVGFGAGEHLVWQAKEHPKVGLIGCEPYIKASPSASLMSSARAWRTFACSPTTRCW